MNQELEGKEEGHRENMGINMVKMFFGAFLFESADFMGRASTSMLYRAGEVVGEAYAHLSPEELVDAFDEMEMTLVIQSSSIQWIFVVDNSIENGICGRGFEPCCHMLRGFFSVYTRAKTRNTGLRCVETECVSSGSDFCRFIVSP